ncbi:MAG: hypothetical protein ABI228_05665 [Burkholderiaceae bacterium]
MSLIVAARFNTLADAEIAVKNLYAHGFLGRNISTFYVSPPTQHGSYAGDVSVPDPDSKGAEWGAVVGAACIGLLFAILGAVIAWRISDTTTAMLIGAGLGAYLGSLWGALWVTGRRTRGRAGAPPMQAPPTARKPGVLLALHVAPEQEEQACELLREAGGHNVERAQGRWHHGKWEDFDPSKPPELEPDPALTPQARMPS